MSKPSSWKLALKARDRVFAALRRQEPDRVPRFEIWIGAQLSELGQGDPARAYFAHQWNLLLAVVLAPCLP